MSRRGHSAGRSAARTDRNRGSTDIGLPLRPAGGEAHVELTDVAHLAAEFRNVSEILKIHSHGDLAALIGHRGGFVSNGDEVAQVNGMLVLVLQTTLSQRKRAALSRERGTLAVSSMFRCRPGLPDRHFLRAAVR